jgi:hypothetical protein
MDNEFILRWLNEWGMHKEVSPTELNETEWGQEFAWTKAVDEGYLIRFKEGYGIRYTLAPKAVDKLTKE